MKKKFYKIIKDKKDIESVDPSMTLEEVPMGKTRRFGSLRLKKFRFPNLGLRKNKHLTGLGKAFSSFAIVFLILLVLFGTLAYIYVIQPLQRVKSNVDNIQSSLVLLAEDFQNKDISNLETRMSEVLTGLDNIKKEVDQYEFLRDLDQTRGYYQNFEVAKTILSKTEKLINKTMPKLKNVLQASGFTVDKNQVVEVEEVAVEGEASTEEEEESSLSLILKELPLYLSLFHEIDPDIRDIMNEVKNINPDYVPNVGSYDLKDDLTEVNEFIDEYPSLSEQLVGFLEYVPELVGSNKETKYLIMLQNEAELRSSGGIITAYGNLTLENGDLKGEITLEDSWTVEIYVSYTLGIDAGYRNIGGQLHLMNSGCGSSYLRAQDSGIYPDLHQTMMMFKDYYSIANRYDPINYPEYDHILFINFSFAEKLLGLVQPLTIEGFGEVTADTLFDFIKAETDNEKYFGTFEGDRKAIIRQIGEEAKKKLFDLPISEIPNVLSTIIGTIQAKDLSFSSTNENMQTFFDKYGMSARTVKDIGNRDYFQLGEAQNCALKLNKWVRDRVDHNVKISEDGTISRDAVVTWSQPKIYEDGLSRQYSPTLQFSYRAWTRFFLPTDSYDIISDGYSRSGYLYYYPQTYYDTIMDKKVSDNIVQFDHRRFTEEDTIEKQQMQVSYNLPWNINYNESGNYQLILQKHPGKSWGEVHNINVYYKGNVHPISVTLDRDKILTFKDGVFIVDNYDKSLDWILDLSERIPWDSLKEE